MHGYSVKDNVTCMVITGKCLGLSIGPIHCS